MVVHCGLGHSPGRVSHSGGGCHDDGGGATNVGDAKSDEPIRRAPPTAQAPDDVVDKPSPELPYLYRDAFLLVPAGAPKENPREYGDERDTWTWHNRSAISVDELPEDDLARIPAVPDGYELAEVTWTEGLRPDGSFGGLSDIHFAYEAPDLLPIQVNIARPVKVAGAGLIRLACRIHLAE